MLKIILSSMIFCSQALAGLPPTSVQGQSDAAAQTKFNFQVPYNQKTDLGGIKALFETGNNNLLLNPNFENTTFSTSWTLSAGSWVVETTNVSSGKQSGNITLSAVNGVVISQSVTPTVQMSGISMEAGMWVKTSATTVSVCLLNAGAEVACTAVPSTNTWQYVSANAPGPASGSVGIDLKTTSSTTATVYVDDSYVGQARNISNLSQAQWVGSVKTTQASSCTYFTTSSTSFVSSGAVAACNASTASGAASAPATKIPAITFATLPPGTYQFVANGRAGTASTNSTFCAFQFNDGTNSFGSSAFGASSTAVDVNSPIALSAPITYTTTQTNITINLQMALVGGSTGGSCRVNNNQTSDQFTIDVYKYPSVSQVAVNPSQYPSFWSGYHDNTCSWARTNAAYGDPTADASCALVQRTNTNFGTVSVSGGVLPAITFTPNYAGSTYYVCARPKVAGATLASDLNVRLWDGTTVITEAETVQAVGTDIFEMSLCGVYQAPSVAAVTLSLQTKASSGAITLAANNTNTSALEWSVVQIDRGLNTPLLLNTVTNANTASTTRINSAKITNGGSCAISRQDGSWISSVSHPGTGACTINFSAGEFSTVPNCTCIPDSPAIFSSCIRSNATVPTSTSTTFGVGNITTGSGVDTDFTLICVGQH